MARPGKTRDPQGTAQRCHLGKARHPAPGTIRAVLDHPTLQSFTWNLRKWEEKKDLQIGVSLPCLAMLVMD